MATSYNLPDPIIEKVGRFYVVRDDFLEGGTKMRYMLPFLDKINNDTIVYASPAQGYAQIALAHCCKILGKKAVIFVAKRREPHERTLRAKRAGAIIYQVEHGYLSNVQSKAKKFATDKGAFLVPFGVDVPDALHYFSLAAKKINLNPSEVWACSGSGALIRGLQLAWPNANFNAVQVGSKPLIGKAKLWVAPEKYEQLAKFPPPYPSCNNYDAKVWQFAYKYASDGALIWNVGR